MTEQIELIKRLERANREDISHEVIGTDPIRVRVENETPASRSDKTTHIVVIGDDWVVSSSEDFLYRDIDADKYVLYLATQDDDLLLRERVRNTVDSIDWDDETDGSNQSEESVSDESDSGTDFPNDEPGRTNKGLGTTTIKDTEDNEENNQFQEFVNRLTQ